ncbi:hypothetical protein MRX96_034317 [Rhipicephalus microplus]
MGGARELLGVIYGTEKLSTSNAVTSPYVRTSEAQRKDNGPFPVVSSHSLDFTSVFKLQILLHRNVEYLRYT